MSTRSQPRPNTLVAKKKHDEKTAIRSSRVRQERPSRAVPSDTSKSAWSSNGSGNGTVKRPEVSAAVLRTRWAFIARVTRTKREPKIPEFIASHFCTVPNRVDTLMGHFDPESRASVPLLRRETVQISAFWYVERASRARVFVRARTRASSMKERTESTSRGFSS